MHGCSNSTALTFDRCTNLVVQNLKIENAQKMHVSFEKSKNVVASNIVVNAPKNFPNTDGIHITDTQNIQISSCTIATGDDCISIVSGSQNVKAMGIICGPGHGISIGSLGNGNSKEYVSDVNVNGAKLYGTTNGVRIKTSHQSAIANIKMKVGASELKTTAAVALGNMTDDDLPPPIRLMNFVSENQLEEAKRTRGARVEDGTARRDRPLFEILKENKDKKDAEFNERFKHRPPKALDEDETEFLDKLELMSQPITAPPSSSKQIPDYTRFFFTKFC
ncbi:Polygalacturonase 1 [Castilleja foliolosa]|uniref:Polygalacturonase 1 n=1 Tax=Castilleja foliolosa TaxID=1961234 RepID=A0ABD3CZZ7_9LAMI